MFRKKYSKYTYVNKKDNSVCTVDCSVFMDSEKEVQWKEDAESGHFYPAGYNLDAKAAAEQKEHQGRVDKATGEEFRDEQLNQQIRLAQQKSKDELAKQKENEKEKTPQAVTV